MFDNSSVIMVSISLLVGITIFLFAHQNLLTEVQASQETNLTKRLLNDYVTSARPVWKDGTPVSLTIDVSFNQLIDIDEKQQVMTAALWLIVKWRDEYLVWNETEVDVDSIALFPQDVWMPDLTLFNSAHDEVNALPVDKPLIVNSSGHVKWAQTMVTKSQCTLTSLYFPYDVQTCPLTFGSWIYTLSKVDLRPEFPKGDQSNFIHNGVWEVKDIPARQGVYRCKGGCGYYPLVTYHVLLERLPVYYIVQLYVPCILFTIVSSMVFYLPCEAGEKTSFAVTMLLSLTVFMLIASDYLPHSSTVPIITQYFTGSLILSVLCVFATVITLQVHHRGDFGYAPPKWLKRLTLHYLAYPMCLKFSPRHQKSWKSYLASELQNQNGSPKTTSCALHSYLKVETDNSEVSVEETEHTFELRSRNTQTKTDDTDTTVSGTKTKSSNTMRNTFSENCDFEFNKEDWLKIAAVLNRVFLVLFLILSMALHAYPFIRYFHEDHQVYDIPDSLDLQQYTKETTSSDPQMLPPGLNDPPRQSGSLPGKPGHPLIPERGPLGPTNAPTLSPGTNPPTEPQAPSLLPQRSPTGETNPGQAPNPPPSTDTNPPWLPPGYS